MSAALATSNASVNAIHSYEFCVSHCAIANRLDSHSHLFCVASTLAISERIRTGMQDNLPDRRIYLLADHLDAILAAGEDLQRLSIRIRQNSGGAESDQLSINAFAHEAKTLEFAAIARIMRAREHASALAHDGVQFAPLARLFVGGTAIVVDAVSHLADRDARAFSDGNDPLEYLRTRGLISPDSGCLAIVEAIAIDETFMLGGQIPLGALLDMCAQFLDTLEEHAALFPEIPELSEADADGAMAEVPR